MPQGVYLFLGYSEKDESLLKEVTGEGAEDALGAIQGLVSYHNVNANKVSANSRQRRVEFTRNCNLFFVSPFRVNVVS